MTTKGTTARPAPPPLKAARFSGRSISAQSFDLLTRTRGVWLNAGAALLRASSVVHEQATLDYRREIAMNRRAREEQRKYDAEWDYSPIGAHAVFLAALGAENAIKAVIIGDLPFIPSGGGTGVLPKDITKNGHDLVALAQRAKMTFQREEEKDALRAGKIIIEAFGRYPSPTKHTEWDDGFVYQPTPLCAAYERIFFTCVEECARRQSTKAKVTSGDEARMLAEWTTHYKRKTRLRLPKP